MRPSCALRLLVARNRKQETGSRTLAGGPPAPPPPHPGSLRAHSHTHPLAPAAMLIWVQGQWEFARRLSYLPVSLTRRLP